MTVSQVKLCSFQIPTTMLHSKSANTSLPQVMMTSRNQGIFVRDLSDVTFQIISYDWLAFMNVSLKRSRTWDSPGHEPDWRFNLHCQIRETRNTSYICTVWHELLRPPSAHQTGSMGQHSPAKALIAKWKEFSDSQVSEFTASTDDDTAFPRLKRQGSRGIGLVRSQLKFIFDISILFILTEFKWKCLHTRR